METNISLQSEEIETLKAIYDSDWVIEDEINPSYSIQLNENVKLYINLPLEYPSQAPPKYELLAPSLKAEIKQLITKEFEGIYKENMGNQIIYQWIERLKEIILNENSVEDVKEEVDEKIEMESPINRNKTLINITHGDTITDRKSAFQGHVCEVHSQEDVKQFLDCLMDNKKIAQATHNMYAFRVVQPNNVILQDCDDDGEHHAGSRMLHLLQILNVTNVAVCVSRWYGGVHLGPDRFKHINNATRQVLLQAGFIKNDN